jgi:PKD repeat protein
VTNSPDSDSVTYLWTHAIDSADGGTSCSFADATAVDTTITCTDDGSFTLTLTADDGVNDPVSDTAALTVSNVAPQIDNLTSSAASCGDSSSVTVSFSDPGANDTHKVVVDWDDGNTDTLDPATSPATLSHIYDTNGNYTVSVTVWDDDGDSDTSSTSIKVSPNFTGFLQPINIDGRSNFKLGSTVPVKFAATCPSGPVSDVVANLKVRFVDPTADSGDVEAVSTSAATAGSLFRYDPTGMQYIFNLSTKGTYGSNPPFVVGTWELKAVVDNITVLQNTIQLKK